MKNNFKPRSSKKNEFKENISKEKSNYSKSNKVYYSSKNKNKHESKNRFEQSQRYNSTRSNKNEFLYSQNVKEKRSDYKNFEFKDKKIEDLVWGKHSVMEVLKGERPINRIWCTSEIRSSEKFFLLLKELKSKGVLVEEVSWSRISQITFGAVHQGIAIQIAFTQSIILSKLIQLAKNKKSFPKIICLDGVTDPHNVGAIIRSAEAFGCDGVVLPQRRSAGITGTVAKVAAGALEHIPISRVVNLNRSLQEFIEEGFTIVGLSEKGNIEISTFESNLPLVIVIGSEFKGISLLTQKYCDYLLKIPLFGKTSSLNASVAAGIMFHQLTINSLKLLK
tara:strand:+ start:185 stop:1189 length:1005 start_codon:yes stop_codon:yes gene_type:complete